jgi:hypothetical protein
MEIQKTPERKSTRSRDAKSNNDSPGRKRVREGTKDAKIKQANRVNDLRARKSSGKRKSPLEKKTFAPFQYPKLSPFQYPKL